MDSRRVSRPGTASASSFALCDTNRIARLDPEWIHPNARWQFHWTTCSIMGCRAGTLLGDEFRIEAGEEKEFLTLLREWKAASPFLARIVLIDLN